MGGSLLSLEGVVKVFDKQPVLNGIDLEVAQGEVVVILGPSGCGKSTLLRCLNGLEPVQGGSIRFQGEDLTSGKAIWQQVRQKIGMVFQSYHLFPHMTVLENILLGPLKVQKRAKAEAAAEALQLLERVGLADKKDAYPRQLSGGQQQRIAIVRALIMHPQVMLFDEVTAALDPEMVKEVLEVMLNLAKRGMTMLIVTHEMGFARSVADQIAFMDQGEIHEIAKPDEFFAGPRSERAQQFLGQFFAIETGKGSGKP
ncbi:amino acid ABC transporter ATP-binding protein [Paenibacillus sp. TH7-28]